MFFAKAEYETVNMDFDCYETDEDMYACIINLEAKAYIYGEMRYFSGSFCVRPDDMDSMVEVIKNTPDKHADVILKTKRGVLKDFKFDLKSVAAVLGDERFAKMELAGWGMKSKPFCEFEPECKKY